MWLPNVGMRYQAHVALCPILACASTPAVPGQPILATVRADNAPLLHLRVMPHLGVWKLVATVEEHPHAQPDEAERQEDGG